MNKTIIGIIIAIIVFLGIIWIARPDSQTSNTTSLSSNSIGILKAEETNFDFGIISMAKGIVKHTFKIKNAGNNTVTIEKIYTSCMCTTATLMMDGKKFGPYGMLGHGFIPKINKKINVGEEATIEVIFDPTAHGPAGVGRVQRTISIENNAGQPIEIGLTALVTP